MPLPPAPTRKAALRTNEAYNHHAPASFEADDEDTVVLAPPYGVLLEVQGCLHLFRGQAGLLKQLRRALRPFMTCRRFCPGPMS